MSEVLYQNKGFSMYSLITTIGIILIAISLSINIYDPAKQIIQARDKTRFENIKQIIAAAERYTTVKKETPNCDRLEDCPTNFPVTDSDEFSNSLKREAFISAMPIDPDTSKNDLCTYQAYLYPSSSNKYFVRWCYESWTEDNINQLNAQPNSYNCSWVREKSIALCYGGPGYEIPQP
ncbi:hypothetical protein HGA91_04325 [candidate division WWE3 bacterium]|nr:hypothetical protein [candidate division WWE3 bacterium]